MESKETISAFKIIFGITGSLFLFAAVFEILGDVIVAVFFTLANRELSDNEINSKIVMAFCWLTGFIITLKFLLRKAKHENDKLAVATGTILSAVLVPILVLVHSSTLLLGDPVNFHFTENYLDIIRNLIIGFAAAEIMLRVNPERRHS